MTDSQKNYISIFQRSKSISDRFIKLSLQNGKYSSSQKQALITLIKEKVQEKRFLKSWRPIFLINVDIKVASKALALRLKYVIDELVHSDQLLT